MATSLSETMIAERKRLEAQRDEAKKVLAETEAELSAIDAYEATKKSLLPSAPAPTIRKGPAPGTKRGDGGSFRTKVLDVVRNNPGLKSGQIIERLDAEGIATKGIGNALSALVKAKLIQQSAAKQPYFPVKEAGKSDGDLERTPPEEAA